MAKLSMGEFLTVLRKGNGYTQEEIAEKLGVSSKTVSSWENGRTYPDIMMLPLIADIYNITVDELVRGERTNNKEILPNEVKQNEKSLLKIRKLKYAKYKERRLIYTISSIVCSLLSLLGLYLMTFVATWTLVFAVLGFLGLITFIVFIIVNEKTYLRNEGILIEDDIIPEIHPFVLSIKMNTLFSLFFSLVSYFIYGLVFIIIFGINNDAFKYTLLSTVEVDITSSVLTVAFITLALGLIGILGFIILKRINIKKYGNEDHKKKIKRNTKVSVIVALCIPASLLIFNGGALLYEAIFGETILNYEVSYLSSTADEFKEKMATYTISNQNLIDAGLKKGDEYILNLPDYWDQYAYDIYDCGNGFVYFCNLEIPLNSVSLYINYDKATGEYDDKYEISGGLYNDYCDAENKENIVYTTYNIDITMPNEMFNKKYSEKYDLYYLEFVKGTYYVGNHKIEVQTSKYGSIVYTDFYYRKPGTNMIEDFIELTYTELEYVDMLVRDSNGEGSFEWIPTLSNQVYLPEDDTTYDILGYGVNTYTVTGYIQHGEYKGQYGHYNIAYYYPIEWTGAFTPYIFFVEIGIGTILLLVLFKKQKYSFEFNF